MTLKIKDMMDIEHDAIRGVCNFISYYVVFIVITCQFWFITVSETVHVTAFVLQKSFSLDAKVNKKQMQIQNDRATRHK